MATIWTGKFLRNLSLTIPARQKVAKVGLSRVNLQFFDFCSGKAIDGEGSKSGDMSEGFDAF